MKTYVLDDCSIVHHDNVHYFVDPEGREVDFEFDPKKFPGDWITWPVPNGRRSVPVKSCEQITFDF